MSDYLPLIEAVAREAGELAMRYYDSPDANQVYRKESVRDLVSDADRAVEALIRERLRRAAPEWSFYGEEGGCSGEGEYRWVVDPIDGTQSFVKHLAFFSISIALTHKGRSIAGAVYAPVLREMFTAASGEAARLNGIPIRVSSCDRLDEALCATGFACIRAGLAENNLKYFNRLMPKIRAIRRCGSAALDLAYVACGRYEAYWELALAPYDVAAGVLLVECAGGRVCDFRGGNDIPAGGVAAANPVLLPQLLEELAQASAACPV